MQGGFPLDLILFAMVAAFLVLRLRSVLGRRTGYERPTDRTQADRAPNGQQQAGARRADPRQGPVVEGTAEEFRPQAAAAVRRVVPPADSPVGQSLAAMAQAEAGFNPTRFLEGAEGAFRMIVTAFAQGDRATLRPLLSDESYAGFEQAISQRERDGATQRTEIRALNETGIAAANLQGRTAEITVRFVSDQVNITMGPNGAVLAGSDALTELVDLWTFQRELGSADPSWKLVGTESA